MLFFFFSFRFCVAINFSNFSPVIGRGGEQISRIQTEAGCKIQIAPGKSLLCFCAFLPVGIYICCCLSDAVQSVFIEALQNSDDPYTILCCIGTHVFNVQYRSQFICIGCLTYQKGACCIMKQCITEHVHQRVTLEFQSTCVMWVNAMEEHELGP